MHYKKTWIFLGIIYIAIIFLASLSKVPEVDLPISFVDKLVHIMMYFILVAWFIQIYEQSLKQFIILIAAMFMGLLIEFLQEMTGYRSFDYMDGIANSVGAICAFLLAKTPFSLLLKDIDLWIFRLNNRNQ